MEQFLILMISGLSELSGNNFFEGVVVGGAFKDD